MDAKLRCHSMPHLSDPYLHPSVPAPKKQYSRVLRSVHKWIRSILQCKSSSSSMRKNMVEFEIYGGYLSSDGLTTIPEGCEKGLESPEFGDSEEVRKTLSERYTSSTGAGGLAS